MPDVVGQVVLIQGTDLQNPSVISKIVVGLLLNRSKMVRLTLLDNASSLFRDLHSKTVMKYKVVLITSINPRVLKGKLDSSSSIFQLPSNPISSALTEKSRSSSARSRLRRFSEVVNSFGDHYHFRSRVPFKSFDDRLQESRLLFSQTVPTIGGYSLHHHNDEATNGYRFLCLRGFVVQGSLDPKDRLLDDVFRFIDNIGWSYTVMHVHPFCPRVVR
ncbi:hypothetical protein F2Q69_00006667 [Brassica cretica]|uniref:Uncharacterized protein n=1 Tax=Brassica cretica TaxID=69181 RepID=A0A8S9P8Q0_BRACR|nr:hypothetical protein F2Q69_00006667 [Brassica cretica]